MNRALLIGPVLFTLIGGGAGICFAMMYRQEPLERAHVYLDDSLIYSWDPLEHETHVRKVLK